jgi:hypothetical protein
MGSRDAAGACEAGQDDAGVSYAVTEAADVVQHG